MQAWLTTQLARVDKWQLPTGGFGWWFLMGLPITQPWLTIHTTHVLVRAKARGISLPHGVLDKALACCKDIERHIGPISETCRIAILAKALWIRSLAAAESAALLRSEVVALLGRMGGVTGKHSNLESVAFLLMAAKLCDESTTPAPLLQHLANSAHETAETATFATSCEKPELPNPSYRSRATDPELPIRSYRTPTYPLPSPYHYQTATKPLPARCSPAPNLAAPGQPSRPDPEPPAGTPLSPRPDRCHRRGQPHVQAVHDPFRRAHRRACANGAGTGLSGFSAGGEVFERALWPPEERPLE